MIEIPFGLFYYALITSMRMRHVVSKLIAKRNQSGLSHVMSKCKKLQCGFLNVNLGTFSLAAGNILLYDYLKLLS